MVRFNPANDIPDLSGKVIIVTGANIGLGREALHRLAEHNPQRIYLTARNKEKADKTIDEVGAALPEAARTAIRFLPCDLTSFESIKAAAKTFTSENDRLDILINNAGIMACPEGKTKEGYEIQFGTNHVGHALLTKLLLPLLEKTAQSAPKGSVRIVNLSSAAEQFAPSEGIKFDDLKTASGGGLGTWRRYGQSKLANIYFSKGLAQRYPEITSVAVHPGAINTNLTSGPIASYGSFLTWPVKIIGALFLKSVAQGALNELWAATAPLDNGDGHGVKSGEFYYPVGVKGKGSKLSDNSELTEKLWSWTEDEFAKHQL